MYVDRAIHDRQNSSVSRSASSAATGFFAAVGGVVGQDERHPVARAHGEPGAVDEVVGHAAGRHVDRASRRTASGPATASRAPPSRVTHGTTFP